MAMLATNSTFCPAAAGKATPAFRRSHYADKLCLLGALAKPSRNQKHLSGHLMLFVPADGILKKLTWRVECKMGHFVRKTYPGGGIFSQHATSEHQNGGVDIFDFLLEKASESRGAIGNILSTTVLLATGMLQAAEVVHAEELTRYSPEQWGRIWITTGVILILYFFVVPLIIYNFLRLRWYTRTLPETIFQFMLVFIFFPGMLLLAPFINFRPLPKGNKKGP